MNKLLFVITLLFGASMVDAITVPANPFDYNLGMKLVGDWAAREVTLCCHGYGHSNEIVDVIETMNIFNSPLIGFNFPDFNIADEDDHTNVKYGTIDEIEPLLYLLKFYACDQKIEKINLYGFSAGGGAVINALAVLNKYSHANKLKEIGLTQDNAKDIMRALSEGVVILECPLKSLQEIIDLRGATDNLSLMAYNYQANSLNPIDTVQLLDGLSLTIFLHQANPDEVLSNRDDALFVDRLKKANKGIAYFTTGSGGHAGFHPELWKKYEEVIRG